MGRIPHALGVRVEHVDGWFLGCSEIDEELSLVVYHQGFDTNVGDFRSDERPVVDLPVGRRLEAAKLIPDLLREIGDAESAYVSEISETADEIAAALAEFDGVER